MIVVLTALVVLVVLVLTVWVEVFVVDLLDCKRGGSANEVALALPMPPFKLLGCSSFLFGLGPALGFRVWGFSFVPITLVLSERPNIEFSIDVEWKAWNRLSFFVLVFCWDQEGFIDTILFFQNETFFSTIHMMLLVN